MFVCFFCLWNLRWFYWLWVGNIKVPGSASSWQGIDLAWPSLAINKHTELNVKLSLLNDIVLLSTTGPSRVFSASCTVEPVMLRSSEKTHSSWAFLRMIWAESHSYVGAGAFTIACTVCFDGWSPFSEILCLGIQLPVASKRICQVLVSYLFLAISVTLLLNCLSCQW